MIYLDHAAATPVDPKVLAAMTPYFSENFFNPSAPYLAAKRVREDYESAKNRLAHLIGAKGNDLVMTAGATESINLAFTVLENMASVSSSIEQAVTPHVLVSSIEHAAVFAAADHYANGNVEQIAVDKTGRVDLADLQNKIRPETMLISVTLANNEIGTIEPLAEIAEIIKNERTNRLKNNNPLPLFLHSDASQALSLVDISVARLGVDLLTLNAAKVYGPKGVGALYVAHGIKLHPVVYGGGQEAGLRSGTENVAGVVGFATAAAQAKDHLVSNRKKYEDYCKIFSTELQAAKIAPKFLGHPKHRLASFCSVCFDGIDAERLIYKLEEKSIYLSTGAACAASKGEKSRTLQAIGLTDSEIAGSLRVSFGSLNTVEEIRMAGREIVAAVNEEALRTGLIKADSI